MADTTNTVRLIGKVTDDQGDVVENATVILRNYSDSQFDLTDERGLFDFKDVIPGKYELVVLHRRHMTIREIIEVTTDSDIDVYAPLE